MFTSRHFFKRHARHWFLWVLSTGQPPWTDTEREREVIRAFSCIPLSLSDKVFLLLSSWEAAPGERSAYYHRVIALLPCSSVAGSSGRISVLSRPPPQKSSPPSHHIRLDYICRITAAPCLARHLIVDTQQNYAHQGGPDTRAKKTGAHKTCA